MKFKLFHLLLMKPCLIQLIKNCWTTIVIIPNSRQKNWWTIFGNLIWKLKVNLNCTNFLVVKLQLNIYILYLYHESHKRRKSLIKITNCVTHNNIKFLLLLCHWRSKSVIKCSNKTILNSAVMCRMIYDYIGFEQN